MGDEKEKPFRGEGARSRERCPNFTNAECERLARLVEARGSVLLDPRTDGAVLREKACAWFALADEFNSLGADSDVPRTVPQLRNKFRNLKKLWRQTMTDQPDESDTGDLFEEQSPKTITLEESNVSFFDADNSEGDSSPKRQRPPTPRSDAPDRTDSPPDHRHRSQSTKRRKDRSKNHSSKTHVRRTEELHRQELKHREEVHALKIKQMKALHQVKMEEARLKVQSLKKSLGDYDSDELE